MVFMDTAVTIPTGALCERWKFSAFIVYCFFVSCVLYPSSDIGPGRRLAVADRQTLGLGCGYVDFAGSGVVHALGGLCGLAGALGARAHASANTIAMAQPTPFPATTFRWPFWVA
jgi:Amt family ammonium transporter